MARVRFHDSNKGRWNSFAELTPDDLHSHFSTEELGSQIFVHEMGDEQTLQLSEVRYPPHVSIELHAHDVDEIFYLVQGELQIGTRTMAPGASVFIAGNTLYSLKSGPDGAHFLVFRPVGDMSYVPEAEWRARGKSVAAAPAQG